MWLSIFSAVVLGVPLLAGCVDPEGRLNEFVSRVPDAKVVIMYDAPPLNEIPDITGTFLLAIHVAATGNALPLQSLATVALTKSGATATANFHIQYLTAQHDPAQTGDRLPIDGATLDENNIAVTSAGEFDIVVGTLTVPMVANPLGFAATAENVHLIGTIKSTDLFCGTLTGDITSPTPLPLAGSTFGAVRVTAGQTGDQLPQPTIKCP